MTFLRNGTSVPDRETPFLHLRVERESRDAKRDWDRPGQNVRIDGGVHNHGGKERARERARCGASLPKKRSEDERKKPRTMIWS